MTLSMRVSTSGRAVAVAVVSAGALLAPTIGLAKDGDEASVLAAERALAEAQMRNDIAAVDRLLAADYAFTIPNGVVVTKARFLTDMTTFWKPTLVENSKQLVRLYGGHTAIVSGEGRYRWVNDQKVEEEARERYTDTYILSGGGWRRVASHSSCLAGRCS